MFENKLWPIFQSARTYSSPSGPSEPIGLIVHKVAPLCAGTASQDVYQINIPCNPPDGVQLGMTRLRFSNSNAVNGENHLESIIYRAACLYQMTTHQVKFVDEIYIPERTW